MKQILIKDLMPSSHGVLILSVQKKRVQKVIFDTLA
jgi:hypothetical protein